MLVLMTKFGRSEKIRPSGFLFWNIWFWQFQNRNMTRAKFEDLKIQSILRHEKGLKSIKESR
jgi:hypothetical protein